MKHRIWTAAIAAALLLAVSVGPALADGYPDDSPWMTHSAGGYSHWITVCYWNAYPLPGGYGGAYWQAMQRAVNTWDALSTSQGGNLHYSLTATHCESGVPEPFVAVGYANVSAGVPYAACRNLGGLGCTIRYVGSDNRTRNTRVILQDASFWYTGTGTPGSQQYDAETVFLHEFGHASTLCHSGYDNNPPFSGPIEVMYPTLALGQVKRSTVWDDDVSFAIWYSGGSGFTVSDCYTQASGAEIHE